MVKRDFVGLLRIYGRNGFYFLTGLFGFAVILVSPPHFIFQDLILLILAIMIVAWCIIVIILSLQSIFKNHKNWLRLEQARQNLDALPLYGTPSSYAPLFQDGGVPIAIKRTAPRHIILKLVLFTSGALSFIYIIIAIELLVNHTSITVQGLLFLALFAIGIEIFSIVMGCIGLLIYYRRIEANEQELIVQFGPFRRRLHWEQVRLFAVGGKADFAPEWIELASAKVLLRLPFTEKASTFSFFERKTPEQPYQPITRSDYQRQLQRLYGYARLRTKLPLRDLRM